MALGTYQKVGLDVVDAVVPYVAMLCVTWFVSAWLLEYTADACPFISP